MALNSDIATVTVGAGGPSVVYQASTITITVVDPTTIGMIGLPIPEPFSVLQVETPGIQGPPGLQNVVVSPTEPPNPFQDMIWFQVT